MKDAMLQRMVAMGCLTIGGWVATAWADATVAELRQRVYRHALAGDEQAALPLARELVVATEQAFGADHLETADSLDALGDRLQKTGSLDEAETVYRRGLAIRRQHLKPGDPQLAASFVAIASTLDRKQQFAAAAAELRQALSLLGKALGADHPDLVPLLVRLRATYIQLGKPQEAEIFHDRELEIRAAARDELRQLRVPVTGDHGIELRPSSPWTGGSFWSEHNVLGSGYYQQKDLENALFHFVRAARLRPDLGEVHNNIGTTLIAMDRLDDAVAEFAAAVRLQPDSLAMRVNLANGLAKAERFAEAEQHLRKATEMAPDNAALHNNLGWTLFQQGRREDAVAEFRRALAIDPNLRAAHKWLEKADQQDPNGQPATGGTTP